MKELSTTLSLLIALSFGILVAVGLAMMLLQVLFGRP